jgi:hypothetical protein
VGVGMNFQNSKLLHLATIPIKNIPFDDNNKAMGYQIFFNMPNIPGQVCTLTLNFAFDIQVP